MRLYLSEPSLAFSHSPGCMFLTDVPDSPVTTTRSLDSLDFPYIKPNPELVPLCFQISHNPPFYSLVSQAAVERIRLLEMIIGDDPGKILSNFLKSLSVLLHLRSESVLQEDVSS